MHLTTNSQKLTTLPSDRIEAMAGRLLPAMQDLLKDEQIDLGDDLTTLLQQVYIPIADWLVARSAAQPHVVGINGAQGSGKSTLSKILKLVLDKCFGLNVAILSIDDLYLTREERKRLAVNVHPLLMTRGVPGTHDVELGEELLMKLCGQAGELPLPRFDKAIDDRLPPEEWPKIQLPVDLVILEGWCVASRPQDEASLKEAINSLEESEDSDGRWRNYVNRQLKENYQSLFEQVDTLIMLAIPGFEKVMEWRSLQEEKLKGKKGGQSAVMDQQQLERFIMHYERLTRFNLQEMPARADLLLSINDQHQIESMQVRRDE